MSSSSDLAPSFQVPRYHLKALRGWMNDPCAPGFDVRTGLYHLFYQWNPKSCDWGQITWGHYISKDGLSWTHNGDQPAIESDHEYDSKGIFTGCMHPTGPRGEKDVLTVFYSSICALPIHWTKPYIRNCAGLSMATSKDGGKTWQKSALNPILKGEPSDEEVVGWRDPYIAEWPAMDTLRGSSKSLYGILSGGTLKNGPTVFIYAVPPTDLSKWTYLGPLTKVDPRLRHPQLWNGNFGNNWECVTFMTLSNSSSTRDFLVMGTECESDPRHAEPSRPTYTLWMMASLRKEHSTPRIEHQNSGILDHGILYGCNSYEHPVTKQRILWGWLPEVELSLELRESKGWTGYLAIPRELFLLRLDKVTGTLRSDLKNIASIEIVEKSSREGREVVALQTLGIRPLNSLKALRPSSPTLSYENPTPNSLATAITMKTNHWELHAVFKIQKNQRRVGFHIRHSKDMTHRTSVIFAPQEEKLYLDRARSNVEIAAENGILSGPMTLFTFDSDDDEGGVQSVEKLRLSIFADGNVVEVFANERFALSALVYAEESWRGISAFADGAAPNSSVIESLQIWDNLGGGQNSSSSSRTERPPFGDIRISEKL